MPLSDTLTTACQLRIDSFDGETPSRRERLKENVRDLTVFDPKGLEAFVLQVQWLEDFALKIEPHKAELVPYVTPYGAALGMLGVWNRILLVWIGTPWPLDTTIPEAKREAGKLMVTEYVKKAVSSYTRMIVK